jgi:hypothetical protein
MRNVVAVLLMGAILTPQPFAAQAVSNGDIVRDLPPGTRLTLHLRSGSEVTGTVVSTTADAVVMADKKAGRPVTFAIADMETAKVDSVPKRYASDEPNGNSVRHVITALGAGKKVHLQSRSGVDANGRIMSIGPDSFVFRQGRRAPEEVRFGDVNQVAGRGMSLGLKAGIIGGAAFGGLMLATGICYWSGSCVS